MKNDNARYKLILSVTSEGFWDWNLITDQAYLSPRYCELVGYSPHDTTFDGRFFESIIHPDDRKKVCEVIDECLQGKRETSLIEYRMVSRDGTTRWIEGRGRVVKYDNQSKPSRMVGTIVDITERRWMESELAQNQKMESLGVLIRGVVHDFNNIFTTVIGNISYARMFLAEAHKSSPLLHNAEEAACQASELAQRLLTFAKGSQSIKETVSVQHILDGSVPFALHGSNASCDIELSDGILDIDADKGQISQLINNIIINAAQSMPDGGKITVKAENATVDTGNIMSLALSKYIRITVTDTGSGITDEDQKRIFDPYFTTKANSSGLGLATAHSIVTNHGGYIGVRSVVGKGSTFEILLPACDKSTILYETGTDPVQMGGQNGFSVLVIDDEEGIRDLLTNMLASLGYRVQTCASGEEAIAIYKAAWEAGSPISAVIVDLNVPNGGVGGKEATQRILAIDPTTQVIVTSGYSTDPVITNYSEYGFCAVLLKPYSTEEMAKVLRSVLDAGEKS